MVVVDVGRWWLPLVIVGLVVVSDYVSLLDIVGVFRWWLLLVVYGCWGLSLAVLDVG